MGCAAESRLLGFSCALLAAAALSLAAGEAVAQPSAKRPVTIVIQFPAGGGSDVVMRSMAPKLSENLGDALVIENRPGASGVIGAAYVAKAVPDGYTLLMGHAMSNAIVPYLLNNVPYDPVDAFTPITYIGYSPNVLVVNPATHVKSMAELIAMAKADPGGLTFCSAGNGSTQHLAGALFALRTGTKLTHIPYKGTSQSLGDLLAGRVTMSFDPLTTVRPHIQSGKLTALAFSTPTRHPEFPAVPTFSEAGLDGFDVTNWYAMMGPKGLPRDIVSKVDMAMKKTMADPAIADKLRTMGVLASGPSTPEEFGAFIQRENTKYAKMVKDLAIRID